MWDLALAPARRSMSALSRLALAGLLWGLGAVVSMPAWAQAAPPAAAASAAAAKPATRDKCLGCHDDKDMKSEAGKPVFVLADDFARSAHRKIDCAECHDAALTVKHPRNPLGAVKPQVCQDCHYDTHIPLFRLEMKYLPSVEKIVAAARRAMAQG